ncbi:hypothetical protein NE237_000827 [Protea cynaroides]|uniref:Hexosyltransferase n=1 Tax=Protea cynaroides TaxID=273540 RepID=A0A9Q0KSV9_9MAGN|nr:hypothetical protein NE237_000827 [Protea cynaroides]
MTTLIISKKVGSSHVKSTKAQGTRRAWNYLADILEPCVHRVIYLDSDVIVVNDIRKFWDTSLTDLRIIGALEYCHANFTKYFSHRSWADLALSRVFKGRNPCYFNMGVMVMDLDRWRQGIYKKKIEGWMQLQKWKRIYDLESRAMTKHIAFEHHGKGTELLYHDLKKMAPVSVWMEGEAHQYDPVAIKLVFEQAVKPFIMKMKPNSTVVEEN